MRYCKGCKSALTNGAVRYITRPDGVPGVEVLEAPFPEDAEDLWCPPTSQDPNGPTLLGFKCFSTWLNNAPEWPRS